MSSSNAAVTFDDDVPDDIAPRAYDLDLDGIFGEQDVADADRQAENDVEEQEEEEKLVPTIKGERYISSVEELAALLKDHANRRGMEMKKEWVNIMKRKYHEMKDKMLKSHVELFLLGIQVERNTSVDKDFKDTATRLNDEVNKVSGISKKLMDSQAKIAKDVDQKMKELTAYCRKMESMVSEVKNVVESASRPSSIASWAQGEEKNTSEEYNYDKFLSMIGFSANHIRSSVMKKCHVAITDEMYTHVISGEADSDDMADYYSRILNYADRVVKGSSKEEKTRPASSSRHDPYGHL
uniref:P protein n=1 Tax=Cytorhabdovirus hordei TaxID=1985699 RepID=A0A4Y1PKR1_9RHAB|nr:P protein [Cytorhabdovirus hordei]